MCTMGLVQGIIQGTNKLFGFAVLQHRNQFE